MGDELYMKVSTKGRYALRMMVDLAVIGSGEFVSLRDVAKRQEVSTKYMEQIVGSLTRSGYLNSIKGSQGGYRLARRANEYTVGDILRTTEGCLAPVPCLTMQNNDCPRASTCPTLPFWEGLAQAIGAYVDSVTLNDLAQQAKTQNIIIG